MRGMNLVLGSPLFMAPELVKKQKGYTEKVDIWALGCIAFLLLSGRNVFQALTVQKINHATLSKSISFNGNKWDQVSKQCKNFILMCLQRDPDNRFSIHQLQNHYWYKMMNQRE